MKRIIYHLPIPLSNNPVSGSQIRPVKILQAFKNLGYEVDVVSGYAHDRKVSINKVKKNIKNGIKYDFLYSESSTMPTALTEKNHLPLYPFLDFNFLKFVKKNNIKIGLFYRDIYWRFNEYYNIPKLKKIFSIFFYKYDLKKYEKFVDILFLPSLKMYDYFPEKFKHTKIDVLYPAINKNKAFKNLDETFSPDTKKINIFYVGGIGKLYSFVELFKAVKLNDNINLTVCVREQEWKAEREKYSEFLSDSINIIHKNGDELIKYYNEADIASLFVEPIEYRNFAMPIKLFEYLAYRKPIIATKNTEVGRFVEKNDVGWTLEYSQTELSDLFNKIIADKKIIKQKVTNINKIIHKNTWEARVNYIKEKLTK